MAGKVYVLDRTIDVNVIRLRQKSANMENASSRLGYGLLF